MMRRGGDGGNIRNCKQRWRYESYRNGSVVVLGPSSTNNACVIILDLATKHPLARGFRKGFIGQSYGYLSPGEFGVAARVDMNAFTLQSTILLDLEKADPTFGGFSGGFTDGNWACFCPYREHAGSHGGIRSSAIVDQNTLRAYFSSVMVCVMDAGWTAPQLTSSYVRKLDLGDLDPNLRGYSDAIRVGRYAYISPLASLTHAYTSRLVRVDLGPVDIATTYDALLLRGLRARNMLKVLDLSQKDPELKGFSTLFSGIFMCVTIYVDRVK